MNRNLRLVINNSSKNIEEKYFFEKDELKIILNLYAQMVSRGSWKDYGLTISNRQVGFGVFKNATENAMYKICKNFRPRSNAKPNKIFIIVGLIYKKTALSK